MPDLQGSSVLVHDIWHWGWASKATRFSLGVRWSRAAFDAAEVVQQSVVPATVADDVERIVSRFARPRRHPCHVVIMSNGGFHGIRERFIAKLGPSPSA